MRFKYELTAGGVGVAAFVLSYVVDYLVLEGIVQTMGENNLQTIEDWDSYVAKHPDVVTNMKGWLSFATLLFWGGIGTVTAAGGTALVRTVRGT